MTRRLPHRIAAGAVAAAVAASAFIAAAPAAAAPEPGPRHSDPIDYFADRIEGLREGSVFESVTFERLEFLLKQNVRIPVVIGGPGDGRFDAVAVEIDAAARAQGVERIYTFDPRLDGADIDIRTLDLLETAATQTRPEVRTTRNWDRIVDAYLNRDTDALFDRGQNPEGDPYLFVYDGDRRTGDADDRIVDAISGAADLSDAGAYRARVAELLAPVAGETFAVSSQFDFIGTEVNRRHIEQYPDAARFGEGDIFTAADEQGFTLQSINYPELQNLLESDGEHVILFGGTWCHNTRAVVGEVNRAARAAGVETVYLFDLRLDGTSQSHWHIRDSASSLSYLYGDLVAEHLPALRTQYQIANGGSQLVNYRPGGDPAAALVAAPKLQVPYLIQQENDGEGSSVTADWIREEANGSFTEYMTEWWWVQGLPGSRPVNVADDAVWAQRQRTAWDFADEAIAKVDQFFDSAVTTPSAPAKPTASVDGSSVTVTWTAPTGETGTRGTGYDVALNGGTPVRVAEGATSYTFTGLAAGDYTATVVARNGLGGSSSSPAATSVRVVAAPEVPGPGTTPQPVPTQPLPETTAPRELQLAVSGDLRPGGRIEVVGSGYDAEIPSVRVELHSTPALLGNATIAADGSFRLAATIPSDVAAGQHSVVVVVDGVEVSRTAVTIAAAPGLAATGADVAALGLGALALLALGTLLVARRRRTA